MLLSEHTGFVCVEVFIELYTDPAVPLYSGFVHLVRMKVHSAPPTTESEVTGGHSLQSQCTMTVQIISFD